MNRRRNYCGITQSGIESTQTTVGSQSKLPLDHGVHCSEWEGCDCKMAPRCCRLYHPADWFDIDEVERPHLASSAKEVKRALSDMPDRIEWEFIPDWPPPKPLKPKKSKSKSSLKGLEKPAVQKKSRKEGKSKFQDKNKAKYSKSLSIEAARRNTMSDL